MNGIACIALALSVSVLCVDLVLSSPMANPEPKPNVNVDVKVNVNGDGGGKGGSHESDYCSKDKQNCGHWCYPSKNWPYICTGCAGQSQSPIDICTGSAKAETGQFTFSVSWSSPIDKLKIKNNGHTVSVSWSSSSPLTISGGGLPSDYTLAGFHFHWGCKDNRGSEHVVDGKRYPMELHFVHYRTSYDNLTEAIKYQDGLAVLGVFFNIGDENTALKPITDNLNHIENPSQEDEITFNKALFDFIPAIQDFYRYQGSLTTPTCNEVVTWSVFSTSITFSEDQAKAFRKLMAYGDHHMCDNYRGIQALNDREITKYTA